MKYRSKPPLGTQLDWSHPLNKGLAGFWLFNEGHGNKVNDLSMNRNTGTLTSMAFPPTTASGWNPGRNGVGLNFDGVNDYVDAGNNASLNITGNMTISAWIKIPSAPATYPGIVTKRESDGTVGYVLALNANNAILFLLKIEGVSKIATSQTFSLNTWHHVVGVYNNITMVTYVDGTAGNPSNVNGSISISSNALKIGVSHLGAYFNGTIDEVRIYNRALSASEVQQLYIDPYCMFMESKI